MTNGCEGAYARRAEEKRHGHAADLGSGLLAVAALLTAITGSAPAGASCDPTREPDRSDIANARAAVDASCDCAGSTHQEYVRCASDQASAALANQDCVRFVKRCASRSTCGRPGFVTCCRRVPPKPEKCSIKHDAARCVAPRGGTACVGQLASCCDACAAGDCATTTTTASTTTTTTSGAVCGNGVVERTEQCDGQVYCTSTCHFRIYACCDIATDSGVCSRPFTPEPGPPYCTDGSTTHLGSDAPGGTPCAAAGFVQYQEGPCGDVSTFAPTTFCCQRGFPCSQASLSDTGSLVSWLLNVCDDGFGNHPAVVGTCGADFQCHPGG